jgi:hypothetical protein
MSNFVLDEDGALHTHLQGLTVTDQTANGITAPARQVGVWFGQPDQELRSQSYPYITIDLIDIQHDTSREHRGKTNAEYLRPSNLSAGTDFIQDFPIPVLIDYQITTYCRHPRHDRQLIASLMATKLPFRFGYLEIPTGLLDTNGNPLTTVRRLDVTDITKRDITEQAKRTHVNSITVRISSEITATKYDAVYKVLSAHLDPATVPWGGATATHPASTYGNFSATIQ